ncbi:hypothetical protein JOF41_004985 [Saccharothrix coeruleofusca]|uniref:hypothetical protein n=1 Tax=Saccharothrix coeruleofusca TaxID=33919 RepID=UPI001AE7577D|nr:hypothetical protein [Saccharothrix coeruleofusca]MBP2338807.1 hypothetical protein [Saccharothrix coeruleofusca]
MSSSSRSGRVATAVDIVIEPVRESRNCGRRARPRDYLTGPHRVSVFGRDVPQFDPDQAATCRSGCGVRRNPIPVERAELAAANPCSTSDRYWATYDFGRHGRSRPGTRLTTTAGPDCGHDGATAGTVMPYDGRWHSTSFPVCLHNRVTLCFTTRPARDRSDRDVPGVYELVGAELEHGHDLSGTQGDGNGGSETVVLRARPPRSRVSS